MSEFENATGKLRRQIGNGKTIFIPKQGSATIANVPGVRNVMKKVAGFSRVDGFDNMEGLENMDGIYENATGQKLKPEMKAGIIMAGTILIVSALAYFATSFSKVKA